MRDVNMFPCDDCNFRTRHAKCWHFGQMNLIYRILMNMRGCVKYCSWRKATTRPQI